MSFLNRNEGTSVGQPLCTTIKPQVCVFFIGMVYLGVWSALRTNTSLLLLLHLDGFNSVAHGAIVRYGTSSRV